VLVKLGHWRNAPLDLVVCLDSSASFCLAKQPARATVTKQGTSDAAAYLSFVESGNFQRAKQFIGQLASELHLPDVQMGLVRFEDAVEVLCPLTGDATDLIKSVQSMSLSPGETKFAPPLRKALEMLKASPGEACIPGGDWHSSSVAKAVIVITDGDPSDMAEARSAAALYKEANVQLLFVKVGQKQEVDALDSLSMPWLRPPALNWTARARSQDSRGVFRASDDPDELAALIPDVCRQLLRAVRPIVRARCDVPLSLYEVAGDDEDLSVIPGHEVCLPMHTLPQHASEAVLWDPVLTDARAYAQEARDRLQLQSQLSMAQLQAKQLQHELQARAAVTKRIDSQKTPSSGTALMEDVIAVASMQQRVDDLCALLPALARKGDELHRQNEALRQELYAVRGTKAFPAAPKDSPQEYLYKVERIQNTKAAVEALAARAEELLEGLGANESSPELLSTVDKLKEYQGYVKHICGSPWREWSAPGDCQVCKKKVDRKEKGLHCQKGGHRICWTCMCQKMDWEKLAEAEIANDEAAAQTSEQAKLSDGLCQ